MRDPTRQTAVLLQFHLISIHRSLAGPDLCRSCRQWTPSYFNPQVPCGTRPLSSLCSLLSIYFNPQVPCGTRRQADPLPDKAKIFQSTGPLRDPTHLFRFFRTASRFQSTGPLRDPTILWLLSHSVTIFQSTGPLRDPTPFKISKDPEMLFQSTGPLRDPTIRWIPRRVRL